MTIFNSLMVAKPFIRFPIPSGSSGSSSDCGGANAAASLFSIALVLCVSVVVVFFIVKYRYKFKGNLSQLKRLTQRRMTIESTYEKERDVTSSATGAVPPTQPTYEYVATSPCTGVAATSVPKSNYSKNIAYLNPTVTTFGK